MPAQAIESTIIISREQLDNLDALNLKLLCADGTLSAIWGTFDEAGAQTSMRPESLHEALYAVRQLVRDARNLVDAIS